MCVESLEFHTQYAIAYDIHIPYYCVIVEWSMRYCTSESADNVIHDCFYESSPSMKKKL